MSKLIILAALFASLACACAEAPLPDEPCGIDPLWGDTEAWYAYGDCSGYYGEIDIDAVEP